MKSGTTLLPNIRRTRLVDEVISEIRKLIEVHDGENGRLPSEAEMAKMLGVGRSTLREAIRVLSHLGLVEVRSGAGTFITGRRLDSPSDASIETLQAAIEFRIAVEVTASRLAAERRTDAQMKDIETKWDACLANVGAAKHGEFTQSDFQFHLSIVAASGNELLTNAYSQAREAICNANLALLRQGPLESMRNFHDELIDALRKKDGKAAESAAREGLEEAAARFRLFEPSPTEDARQRGEGSARGKGTRADHVTI